MATKAMQAAQNDSAMIAVDLGLIISLSIAGPS